MSGVLSFSDDAVRTPVYGDILASNGMNDAKSCISEPSLWAKTNNDGNTGHSSKSIFEEMDAEAKSLISEPIIADKNDIGYNRMTRFMMSKATSGVSTVTSIFAPAFNFVTNGLNTLDQSASILMGDDDSLDETIHFCHSKCASDKEGNQYVSSNAGIQGRVDEGTIFAFGGACAEWNSNMEDFHSGVTNANNACSRRMNYDADDSAEATATTTILDARAVDDDVDFVSERRKNNNFTSVLDLPDDVPNVNEKLLLNSNVFCSNYEHGIIGKSPIEHHVKMPKWILSRATNDICEKHTRKKIRIDIFNFSADLTFLNDPNDGMVQSVTECFHVKIRYLHRNDKDFISTTMTKMKRETMMRCDDVNVILFGATASELEKQQRAWLSEWSQFKQAANAILFVLKLSFWAVKSALNTSLSAGECQTAFHDTIEMGRNKDVWTSELERSFYCYLRSSKVAESRPNVRSIVHSMSIFRHLFHTSSFM